MRVLILLIVSPYFEEMRCGEGMDRCRSPVCDFHIPTNKPVLITTLSPTYPQIFPQDN